MGCIGLTCVMGGREDMAKSETVYLGQLQGRLKPESPLTSCAWRAGPENESRGNYRLWSAHARIC